MLFRSFYPVAVENELWKLMFSVGNESFITREALDELVGRSKEEAVYTLSDPVGRGDLPEALGVLARLFEDGVFPLIPLAILRNAVRKMLLFRALMAGGEAGLSPQSRYADFQNRIASCICSKSFTEISSDSFPESSCIFRISSRAFSMEISGVSSCPPSRSVKSG